MKKLTKKQIEQMVLCELRYLVAEGFVADRGDGIFRMKTTKELNEELQIAGGVSTKDAEEFDNIIEELYHKR